MRFFGMRFRGNHKFKRSDNISLEFDPSNQYDKNAIKVMVYGIQYIVQMWQKIIMNVLEI
jgi:hypothetical protein